MAHSASPWNTHGWPSVNEDQVRLLETNAWCNNIRVMNMLAGLVSLGRFMKTLIILLVLSPAYSFSQSPFDGTWLFTAPLPQEPAIYLLAKGMFRCSGCLANIEIEADGDDHHVAETAYWDTVNVQIVDAHTMVFIAKKAGKTMFTEVGAVSPDGGTLTQLVKDTTEAATVTIETRSRRIAKAPAGSHAISGSWRAYETNRSRNGSISQYK